MTDAQGDPAAAPGGAAGGPATAGAPALELPIDPQRMVEAFRALDRVMRAHLMYLPNNPSYVRALDIARTAFRGLLGDVPEVELTVTETALLWRGVVIHEVVQKGGDSLPWLLYKDGVRDLALYRGFEGAEFVAFLRCLGKARRATAKDDDLLVLLWEQDFEFLRYRYVETFEEVPPLVPGETPGEWSLRAEGAPTLDAVLAELAAVPAQPPPTGGTSRASVALRAVDAEQRVGGLAPAEVEYLRSEGDREVALDVRRAVLGALYDMFEEQRDPEVRAEVIQGIESLCVQFIDTGHFADVAYAMREMLVVLERATDLTEGDRATLGRIAERMSNPETLGRMLDALEEREVLPSEDDLVEVFRTLKVGAIATLFDFSARSRNAILRPIIATAIEGLAVTHTADLVRLVLDDRAPVAKEAARLAGQLGVTAAVAPLATLVQTTTATDLRVTAMTALTAIGTPDAIGALEPVLADPEREIRLAAMKTLTARRFEPARERAAALLHSKKIRDLDRTERLAVFELFGSVCGDGGVPELQALLGATGGGLFSRGGDTEMRAAAAIALSRVGTPTARQALEAFAADKDAVVRAAVARSLRALATPGGAGA